MGRASKIYKDNSSPEEVEEILKEQTLNLENYNAGVIICNWKDNEKGFEQIIIVEVLNKIAQLQREKRD